MEVSWLILIIILAIFAGMTGLIWYLGQWAPSPRIKELRRRTREERENTERIAQEVAYVANLLSQLKDQKQLRAQEAENMRQIGTLIAEFQQRQSAAAAPTAVPVPVPAQEAGRKGQRAVSSQPLPLGKPWPFVPTGSHRDQSGIPFIPTGVRQMPDGFRYWWKSLRCPWESPPDSSGEFPKELEEHVATCDFCKAELTRLLQEQLQKQQQKT